MNVVSGRARTTLSKVVKVSPEGAGVVHVNQDGPAELAAQPVDVHVPGMIDWQTDLVFAEALYNAGFAQGVEAFHRIGTHRVDVAEGDGLVRASLVRLHSHLRGHRATVPGGRARARLERQEHRDAPAVSADMPPDFVD